MIRLVSVSRRVGERLVLDDVTLRASAGELTLIEASRGAGKTSLLRIVAGLDRADAGEVWIGDRDVARLQRASLPYVRRNVGYLPPDGGLIGGETAIENVMLAFAVRGAQPPEPARLFAWDVLKRLGASACAEWNAERLSSGERRLVALARALAGRPPVLVLDDPSAALGPADEGTVLSTLLDVAAAGACVVVGSSDAAFVSAAVRAGGRRIRLEAGRVEGGATLVAIASGASPPARAAAAAHGSPADETER